MIIVMMMEMRMMTKACWHIPTVTNSHPGGNIDKLSPPNFLHTEVGVAAYDAGDSIGEL